VNDSVRYSKDDYTLFEFGRLAGLDEDTEWQILQAYLTKLKSGGKNADLTINDVWVEKYFGTYCPGNIGFNPFWENYHAPENQKVVAVMMGAQGQNNGTEQQEIRIGYHTGGAFVRDGNRIFLWYDRRLYTLEDGCDAYILLSWDILEVVNLQNGLDSETQLKIQEDCSKSISALRSWPSEYYREIPLHYLGTYNDYIVLIALIGTSADMGLLVIDNVQFHYSSGGHRIFAWKEGALYELDYLFEQGLVTHEDLVEMAYNLNGREEK